MGRFLRLIFAGITLCGCAIAKPTPDYGPAEPLADFGGAWVGDSISSTDARRVNIGFAIDRKGGDFIGTYHCSPGNANCRNQMTSGWVRGVTSGRSFRVSLPDTSWCLFTLGTFYINAGEGEYVCYQDASIIEQGAFEIHRADSGGPKEGVEPHK